MRFEQLVEGDHQIVDIGRAGDFICDDSLRLARLCPLQYLVDKIAATRREQPCDSHDIVLVVHLAHECFGRFFGLGVGVDRANLILFAIPFDLFTRKDLIGADMQEFAVELCASEGKILCAEGIDAVGGCEIADTGVDIGECGGVDDQFGQMFPHMGVDVFAIADVEFGKIEADDIVGF